MIVSLGLLILLGSSLLFLAEEKDWLVYMRLALYLVMYEMLVEIVHKL